MKFLSNAIFKAAAWAASILPAKVKRLFYRIPFLSKLIRKTLNAATPAGFTQVTIASGPAAGLDMSLDLHAEKDYWLGTYEPNLQLAAQKLVSPGNMVYDIGANIGYISLMCANLTGEAGHIFSFEALPKNIDRFKGNVAINHLAGRITIVHAAVVSQSGPATFYTHASGAMGKAAGSAGRDEDYLDSVTVNGVALDDFVYLDNNPAPDVVKMDIEGGEGNALLGAQKLLSSYKPNFLIELHGEVAARMVWETLISHGYQIHTLERNYSKIDNVAQLDWKAYIAAIHRSKTISLK